MLVPLSDCEPFVAADMQRQARVDYITRYLNSDAPWDCRHGHFDCALVSGGACSNELVDELHGLVDEQGQDRLLNGDL